MKTKSYRELLIMSVTVYVLFASGLFGQSVISDARRNSAKLTKPTSAPSAGCNDGWDTIFTTNGVDGTIQVVTSDAVGNVYIGGSFTVVNGVPASGIAKWDGAAWSAIGTGVEAFGVVRAIAVSGNDVYIGGGFASAGGVPAKNVAKWNGTSWSALGAGLGGGTHVVEAVALFGSDVFIGGSFNTADGSPASGFVRWDGAAYSAVAGIVGQVNTIGANGGSVMYRVNLSELAAGGTIHFDWALPPGQFNLRLVQGVQGTTTTMYAATHVDNNTLRLYTWLDASNTPAL